jgi:hypothetical protein
MPEEPNYGQIAYVAYCGYPLWPTAEWVALTPEDRQRWADVGEAVAKAAYDYLPRSEVTRSVDREDSIMSKSKIDSKSPASMVQVAADFLALARTLADKRAPCSEQTSTRHALRILGFDREYTPWSRQREDA